MTWLERLHASRVHTRRVRVLAATAARLLPPRATVLDIGCGDGLLAATLAQLRPDLTLTGVELAPRPDCRIPVSGFDGEHLPSADRSYDAALLVDVLHHTDSPRTLLAEAARVSRTAVLLKDHCCDGLAAHATLRFMDDVGNRRHAVALPHHYLTRAEWTRLFAACALGVEESDPLPHLYPFPANLVFGRRLHFFARLQPGGPSAAGLPPEPS